jgi:hypothetical protein
VQWSDKKAVVVGVAMLTTTAIIGASTGRALAGDDGWRHQWNGPLAAGVLGGLAAGAIVNSGPHYGYYQPEYAPAPAYYGYDDPPPLYCHRVRQPLYDAYGAFVGYRRVRVCE